MSNKKKKEKRNKRSTSAAAKKRAETHKTGFDNTAFEMPDDVKQFALKSDKAVRLDIIPYEVGEDNPWADKGQLHYERTYWVHRGIGVDSTSYICLAKTCGDPCPICEHRAKLAKDSNADEDLIKDLAPKERQLFNVINTKEKNKGVQIWEISFHLFGKRLDKEIQNSDEDDGYEKFAELENGFTLKCGVDEKSFGGKSFYEVSSINFKPRDDDYDEDILEQTTCLDDILIIKDYDDLKEIFLQTKDDDDDDKKDKKDKKNKKDKGKKSNKEREKVQGEDDDNSGDGDGDNDDWEKGSRVIVEVDDEDFHGKLTSVDDDDETADVEFDDGDTMDDVAFADLKPEPEKKDKKDKKSNKKDKKSGKSGGGKKCPGGGTFGKDTDQLKECADCPRWDKCDDAD